MSETFTPHTIWMVANSGKTFVMYEDYSRKRRRRFLLLRAFGAYDKINSCHDVIKEII